jgi:hypothetical protein
VNNNTQHTTRIYTILDISILCICTHICISSYCVLSRYDQRPTKYYIVFNIRSECKYAHICTLGIHKKTLYLCPLSTRVQKMAVYSLSMKSGLIATWAVYSTS